MSKENSDEGKGFCWKVTSSRKKMFYGHTINGKIDQYYKGTLSGMIGNERELRKELRKLRSEYNRWKGFADNIISSVLVAFLAILFGNIVIKDLEMYQKVSSIYLIIFLLVAACQLAAFTAANNAYEKMEVVKAELEKIKEAKSKCEEMKVLEAELNEMKLIRAELEKINNTIQPNPKKTSIRIYNRSSVRRSNFGR